MARGKVKLPPTAKRGQNVMPGKKGWKLVNPKSTRTFKGTLESKFYSQGRTYVVFRVLRQG